MKDGFSYTGEWLGGEIHGFGTATYANGDVYTGSFVDGRRQGTGTMRYATGGVESGTWDNGVLQPAEDAAPAPDEAASPSE
jgi:hypothetical protein